MEWGLGCCCSSVEGHVCGFATCCRGTIVPDQASLVVSDPGGGSYACRSLYYGTFDLFTAENCWTLRSDEKKVVTGTGCPLSPLNEKRYVALYLPAPSVIRVEALSVVNAGGVTGGSGRWEYAGTDIRCLSEIVLTKVSTDHPTFPMPSTVTLTPY